MPQFRIADLDLHWTGVDDATPPGHIIANGYDPVGNLRVFLWEGDRPTDDNYRGSLILTDRSATAYGPRGGYVKGIGGHAELLVALVDNHARSTYPN